MADEHIDIDNMSQDELFNIFEEIPSDDDSIVDDDDESEEVFSAHCFIIYKQINLLIFLGG